MSHDGLAWYAKNLWKSARSVGDKYAHNALKNRLDVFILPRISQISTDAMRGAFIKNTDCTDAHGSIITDLLFFLFF